MNRIEELLELSVAHESIPVPVDPRLARSAWAALAALGVAVPVHALLLNERVTPETTGILMRHVAWIATLGGIGRLLFLTGSAALAVAVFLAATTSGFSIANRAEHWATAAIIVIAIAVTAPLALALLLGVLTIVLILAAAMLALFFATALLLLGGRRR
jgi:hypothetical protein